MAANYWQSSQHMYWTLDRKKLAESNKKDQKFLTQDEIKKLRIFYSHVIMQVGKLLGLRQRAAATACIYFKRFYVENSFVEFEPSLIAATTLYLSSKVEECNVRVDHIIKQMRSFGSFLNFTYSAGEIIQAEFYLLESLKCFLIIYHPYRCLPEYLADANLNDCLDTAWKLVNDSYRTDVLLLYPPHIIALACIYLVAFQKDKDVSQWFSELNVEMKEIKEVCQEMIALFEIWNSDFEHAVFEISRKFQALRK
jgi:cyclin C